MTSSAPAPVRCSGRWISSPQLNNGASPPIFASRVSPFVRARRRVSSLRSFVGPVCCSSKNDHGEADAGHAGDVEVVSVDPIGSGQCGGKQSIRSFSSKEHITISLEMLLELLKIFGPIIHLTVLATSPVGVDLHAEERLERCNYCFSRLQKIKQMLHLLTRKPHMDYTNIV